MYFYYDEKYVVITVDKLQKQRIINEVFPKENFVHRSTFLLPILYVDYLAVPDARKTMRELHCIM